MKKIIFSLLLSIATAFLVTISVNVSGTTDCPCCYGSSSETVDSDSCQQLQHSKRKNIHHKKESSKTNEQNT